MTHPPSGNDSTAFGSDGRTEDRDLAGSTPSAGPPASGGRPDLPVRDRLRARTDLTPRQWMIAVSVLLFLPYPVFVALVAYTTVDTTLVGIASVGYSLVAIALHYLL